MKIFFKTYPILVGFNNLSIQLDAWITCTRPLNTNDNCIITNYVIMWHGDFRYRSINETYSGDYCYPFIRKLYTNETFLMELIQIIKYAKCTKCTSKYRVLGEWRAPVALLSREKEPLQDNNSHVQYTITSVEHFRCVNLHI